MRDFYYLVKKKFENGTRRDRANKMERIQSFRKNFLCFYFLIKILLQKCVILQMFYFLFLSQSRAFIILIIFAFLIFNVLLLFWGLPEYRQVSSDLHQLCVILPYRDRWNELKIVIPKLDKFLYEQRIVYHFIVINQTDKFRFNRAALINIGSMEAKNRKCDYLAIHDVDIIPMNPKLDYKYPGKGKLMHITSGQYHPIARYNYRNYIGGVLIIALDDFIKVNGMSNNYWGWGLEDDEFYLRLKEFGFAKNILRPENLTTDRSNTFLHLHNKKRDYKRNEYKQRRLRGRDETSGLSNLNFIMKKRQEIAIGTIELSIVDVELICNQNYSECFP